MSSGILEVIVVSKSIQKPEGIIIFYISIRLYSLLCAFTLLFLIPNLHCWLQTQTCNYMQNIQ